MTNEELKAAIDWFNCHYCKSECRHYKTIIGALQTARELSQLKDGTHPSMVMVPKCTPDKLHIAEKALAEITVYDLFDCSAVEDTDFQEQAKFVYKIAENAIKEMIKIGGNKQNVL